MKNSMVQRTLLASAVMAASTAFSSDLVISEYIEGSGYDKAIELYNLGSSEINLNDYRLVKYTSGDSSKSSILELNGTLPAGETYVIAHSRSSDELKRKAQLLESVVTNFNGDDPVALQTETGENLDVIGIFGDIDFGKDKTLSRKPDSRPSSTYDVDQWNVLAKGNSEGLGKAPGGDNPVEPAWQCQGDLTDIYDIQGDGERSPLIFDDSFIGATVTVKGVVTKRVESLFKGFFLQSVQGDNNVATSDGLFVFTGEGPPATIKEGSFVCLQGRVSEYFNQTQLSLTGRNFEVLKDNPEYLAAVNMDFDLSKTLNDQLEKFEGMRVNTSGSDLVVTRNFGFDFDSRRNNMVLSLGSPLYKPTHKFPALSSEAKKLADRNSKNQLYIDTDAKPSDGVIPFFEDFNADTGYIRVGDRVENLVGVIAYSYGKYRLIPETGTQLAASDFVHDFSDRTSKPDVPENSDLKVASFNVLNYFNSGVGGDENPARQNRGAGENQVDFQKQRTKIVNALVNIDADIVGLMELENNGFGENSAIQDLVTHLNAKFPDANNHYQYISSQDGSYIGTDAITVGLIYRPSKVAPAKSAYILKMPIQKAIYQAVENDEVVEKDLFKGQRNALIQEFSIHVSDGKTSSLTIAVNHLKSKGSQCFNDYAEYEWPVPLSRGRIDEQQAKHVGDYEDDSQGSCNEFRLSAAKTLGDYMRKNTAGNVLLLGDLNAYGMEDPLRLLTDYDGTGRKLVTAPYTFIDGKVITDEEGEELSAGYKYINLVGYMHGRDAFSYTYAGELGSLDHALGSGSILSKLTEATDWPINSLESALFEYSRRYSGNLEKSDNSFSSSDHDPVILTLDYSLSEALQVKLEGLSDAKVYLEMAGYHSDSFASAGIASPELPRRDVGRIGFLSAEEGLRYLSAYEVITQSEMDLNVFSTAWALVLEYSQNKENLLSMSGVQLRQAKLGVSRDAVTRAAVALELAKKLDLDDRGLVTAVLDNPGVSYQKVLINIFRLDRDRKEIREMVTVIEHAVKPIVRDIRQSIINEKSGNRVNQRNETNKTEL